MRIPPLLKNCLAIVGFFVIFAGWKNMHSPKMEKIPYRPDYAHLYETKVGDSKAEVDAYLLIMSCDLQVPVEWIVVLIHHESGWITHVKCRVSTASGYFQWLEATAKAYGTTTALIRKMTPLQQLKLAHKYLANDKEKNGGYYSLADMYLALLAPSTRKRIAKSGYEGIVFRKGTSNYKANIGLDVNKDGVITYRDVSTRMAKLYPACYKGKSIPCS